MSSPSSFISMGSGAVFNNQGTFVASNDGGLSGGQGFFGMGTFDNMGTFRKSAGNTGFTEFSQTAFNNSGMVEILSGTLRVNAAYTQTAGATRLNGGEFAVSPTAAINGGTLEGMGTVTGDVSVGGAGTVSPGLSPGLLNVTGTYRQAGDGTYLVEIGGAESARFDRLAVTGAATLSGRIDAELIDGFTPNVGQNFQVMTFNSRTGDFANLSGLVIGDGFGFRRILNDTDVTLRFVQEICNDGQDNDGDGRIDCQDDKCFDVPACLVTPTLTPTSTPTRTVTQTATAMATPTSTEERSPTPTPTIDCVGDCQGDRVVTVDEVIIGVNIALGLAGVDLCPVFDFNGDGFVTVDELITAVRQALEGCPALATPTSTPTTGGSGPTATRTPPAAATPTATNTPGASDPNELIAGGSTIVVNAMGVVPNVVGAVVNGIRASGAALVAGDPVPRGAGNNCPLGGTARRSGSFPFITITLNSCRAATASGTVTYNGLASIQLTSFTIDIDMTFADSQGSTTSTAEAMVSGTVGVSTGGSCFLTSATLVASTGVLRMMTPEGDSVAVQFQNTRIVIDQIMFNANCLPAIYRMTFNGRASLLPSSGEPIGVSFDNLVMNVDDSGEPTVLSLGGTMNSPCFGGVATLSTNPSLSVSDGEICPSAGTIMIGGVGATSFIHYRSGGAVDFDTDGDGSVGLSYPSCLDPQLFMCMSSAAATAVKNQTGSR